MRVASFALFFACFTIGCSTARYDPGPPPDASTCTPLIEYPCKPLPHGADACEPDASASGKLEKQIPLDASYPYACTVIVPDPTPDESGNCVFDGTCRCDELEDGGLGWICSAK